MSTRDDANDARERRVRYVCGQCVLDVLLTMDETTEHWREYLKPLLVGR